MNEYPVTTAETVVPFKTDSVSLAEEKKRNKKSNLVDFHAYSFPYLHSL